MIGQGYDPAVYATLFDNMSLAVVVHGGDGKVVDANQAFADLLGYTRAEALALSAGAVIHSSVRAQRDADAHRLIEGEVTNLTAERCLIRKDGTTIWARVRKTAIHDHGQPVVMVTIEDFSEQRAHLQDLTFTAHHDALTGLLNRAGLRHYLEQLGPERAPSLVVMVDVNELKPVNDTYGHAVGDELLRLVAQRLDSTVPTTGVVARLAGDEFVMVAPVEGGDTESRIRRIIGQPAALPGCPHTLTPSVALGSAVLPTGAHLTTALSQADRSMYRNKRSTRHARDRRR